MIIHQPVKLHQLDDDLISVCMKKTKLEAELVIANMVKQRLEDEFAIADIGMFNRAAELVFPNINMATEKPEDKVIKIKWVNHLIEEREITVINLRKEISELFKSMVKRISM